MSGFVVSADLINNLNKPPMASRKLSVRMLSDKPVMVRTREKIHWALEMGGNLSDYVTCSSFAV